jgi:hypothetical protein
MLLEIHKAVFLPWSNRERARVRARSRLDHGSWKYTPHPQQSLPRSCVAGQRPLPHKGRGTRGAHFADFTLCYHHYPCDL